jgi:hypothetical protein
MLISIPSYPQSPNWLWAKGAGGTSADYGNSVAVDASGDAFVTGWFGSPAITFGSNTLTSAGNNDIFLAKLEAGAVNVNDLNYDGSILVYPNPASNKITIKVADKNAGSIISIADMEGQQLLQQELTGQTTSIDISNIPKGMYFIKVSGNKDLQIRKFIKE